MNITFRPQFSALCTNKDDFKTNAAFTEAITLLETTPNTPDVVFTLTALSQLPNVDSFRIESRKKVDGKTIEGSYITQNRSLLDSYDLNMMKRHLVRSQNVQ